MAAIQKFKERFRLIVEAAVKNALVSHGFPVQGEQHKWKSVEELVRFESAKVLARINRGQEFDRPYAAGFKGFSQFNEDGILDYLVRVVGCPNKTFVEIGVEDYRESNTRFLLEHLAWSGRTVDAGDAAAKWLRSSKLEFFHDIAHIKSFVTKGNADAMVNASFAEVDVLSIDVDGMDYYLWQAIVSQQPRIVVIEFNPLFGKEHKVVVPYRDDFERKEHHFSSTCYGASLSALVALGESKGYCLVETSDGPNAFFVRKDCLGDLKRRTPQECWRNWNIKEALSPNGVNEFLSTVQARISNMADGKIIDLEAGKETTVCELFPSNG
ncbi:MAG: hypothetical protein WCK51_10535 [Armatimonadota bacterium]